MMTCCGIGPAQRRPQRLQTLLLADDVVQRGRAAFFPPGAPSAKSASSCAAFPSLCGTPARPPTGWTAAAAADSEVQADDDGEKEVDQPEDAHHVHHRPSPPRPNDVHAAYYVRAPGRQTGKPAGNSTASGRLYPERVSPAAAATQAVSSFCFGLRSCGATGTSVGASPLTTLPS